MRGERLGMVKWIVLRPSKSEARVSGWYVYVCAALAAAASATPAPSAASVGAVEPQPSREAPPRALASDSSQRALAPRTSVSGSQKLREPGCRPYIPSKCGRIVARDDEGVCTRSVGKAA